jgi:hypothetical protein
LWRGSDLYRGLNSFLKNECILRESVAVFRDIMDVEKVRFFVARVGGRELKLVTVLAVPISAVSQRLSLLLNPTQLVYWKK